MSLYFPNDNSFYIHLRKSSTDMCRTNVPAVWGAAACQYEHTKGQVSSSRSSLRAGVKGVWIGDFELGWLWKKCSQSFPTSSFSNSFNFKRGVLGVGGVVGWSYEGSSGNCPQWGDVNLKLVANSLSLGCLFLSPTFPHAWTSSSFGMNLFLLKTPQP